MRTDHDFVQRAVVLCVAVMRTLRNGALNALIGLGHAAHGLIPLLSEV